MNIDFLITSLIVVASPGTGALVTVAAGLSRGVRTSIVAALGCTLGILTHMLVAITGPAGSSREVIWQAILVNLLNLRCTASLRQMFVSGFFRALVFSTGCAGDSWRLLSDSESNWPWYTGSPCAPNLDRAFR